MTSSTQELKLTGDEDLFIAQQNYEAKSSDEINLKKGDIVEIIDTVDSNAPKKPKLDPELDELESGGVLDSTAARHKLSVKPKRKYRDTRQTNININTRWKVRIVSETPETPQEGWVPTLILRPADEPGSSSGDPGTLPAPPDTPYRRDAVIRELIDTEEEFCADLHNVLEKYYFPLASDAKLGNARPPKCVRDNHELIFGNLKQISEFHNTVLMEGVKYYASEPVMIGRVFLRLERDFDKHVNYCRDEPLAQHFLQNNLEAKDYFMEVSQRLGDDKTLSEHLKLPIQRINDYQLLLKELVKYTLWLQEDASYLQRALELMLSVPHRATDDKFTSSIEGYRGSIYKLGRLLAHDWYSITKSPTANTPVAVKKERYLFLFKARILVCKVKRISEDRSVFPLKDIIKLPDVEVRDFPNDSRTFELHQANTPGYPLTLTAHRDLVKLYWLDEIRQYSSDLVALEEHAADDLQLEKVEETVEKVEQSIKKVEETTVKEHLKITQQTTATTSTESFKTAEGDVTLTEALDTSLHDTVLSEAKTVIVEAKRAIVIPVAEPLQAEVNTEISSEIKEIKTEVKIEGKSEIKEVSNKTIEVTAENLQAGVKTESISEVKAKTESKSEVKETQIEVSSNQTTEVKAEPLQSEVKIEKEAKDKSDVKETEKVVANKTIEVKVLSTETKEIFIEKPKKSEIKSISTSNLEQNAAKLADSQKAVESKDSPVELKQNPINQDSDKKESASETKQNNSVGAEQNIKQNRTELQQSPVKPAENPKPIESNTKETPVEVQQNPSNPGSNPKPTKVVQQNPAKLEDISKPTDNPKPGDNPNPTEYHIKESENKQENRVESCEKNPTKTEAATIQSETGEESAEMSRRYGSFKSSSTRSEYHEEVSATYSSSTTNGRQQLSEVHQSAAISSSSEILQDGKLISSEKSGYAVQGSELREGGIVISSDQSVTIESGSGLRGRPQLTSGAASSVEISEIISETSKTQASSVEAASVKTESKTIQSESASTEAKGKPIFTETIQGCSVEPGDNAEFKCKLGGGRTDSLTWLKENKPLDDKLADRLVASASEAGDAFSLKILHCLESDSGTYTALALNAEGKATCTAQLLVQQLTAEQRRERVEANAPVFLVQLKDTELLEDTYLRFMIKVKGDPHPNLTFYKDDKEITDSHKTVKINRDHAENGYYEMIIEKVKYEDAGLYRCVAENKFGQVSSQAQVRVTDHKNIFGELEKEGLLAPGSVPKFMWQRNGVYFEPDERFKVLMGEDEDSLALVFQHVKPEDAGLYTCVAQTSSGLVSCSAELTVQGAINQLPKTPEKPKVIIEQKTFEASAGGSAMLDLQVTGYPRPLVTWTCDGKPIEAGGKYKFLYEDTQSYSLVIKNVTTEDAGKYEVKAKNDLGIDVGELELNIKAPPKFKSKIEDSTCMADETLRIKMELDGSPKPSLKIYKDGQEVQKSDRIQIESEGTTYTLIIKDAKLSDSGSYSVVATNELAQASEFWKTKIYSKPKIIKKLGENIVRSESENASFEIKVESDPAPIITWYKNDKEITSDTTTLVRTSDGQGIYGLKITGTVSTDSGRYKCVLKNEHGTTQDSARLDIRGAPVVREQLRNITVTEGDVDIELVAAVDGFPKPNGKWFLGDVEITESRNEFEKSVDEDGNYKLKIKEANSDLSGKYTLKLTNELGATENSAELTVNCKPKLKKTLTDTIVDEGATLNLQIEVVACPEPEVKWYKNGTEVSADARIKITRDTQRNETYNLTVDLVKYEDGGEYEVIVQNVLGSVSSKSTVTVHTIPQILDTNLEDGQIFESQTQKYFVKASGIPTPEAEWFYNGEKIKSTKTTKIKQEELTYTLEMPKMKKSKHQGKYECKLQNRMGEIVQTGNLTVIDETDLRKPTVCQGLSNQKAPKHEGATLSAVITGDPEPYPTWYHKTTELTKTEIISFSTDVKEVEDGLFECTFSLNISDCVHAHSGEYTLKANNKHGECESTARLDVLLKPELFDLYDVSAVPGESGELSVTIHSNPEPVVTWSKDDVEITASESYRMEKSEEKEQYKLIIENVTLADEGKYVINASNEFGEASGSLRLNTQTQTPSFITKLTDQIIEDTATATLHVRCDGLPKPQVTWLKDDKPIESNEHTTIETKKEAQVTSDLTITNFRNEDSARYSCVAKNLIGEAETNCRVGLAQTPPTFGKKLDKGLEVFEGKPFELKTTISGSPKPTVNWYKDGEPIKDNDHIKTELLPDGTLKLSVEKATPNDSGAYKVVVTNPNGQTASMCAVVVNPEPLAPEFEKELKNVSVNAGQPLKLEAKVNAYPPPKIEWTKDGVPIKTSQGFNVIKQPDGTVGLEVDKSKPDHAGLYTLTASNKLGEVTGEANVEILPESTKPSFGGELIPMKVVEGFPAKLEIKVLGHPKPTVKWTRNGVEIIPDRKHIRITESPDGTCALLIDKCTPHDSGPYEIHLENENGETSNKAVLSIIPRKNDDAPEERPIFLHDIRDVITDEGTPLVIEAPFRGNPIPSVSWTKDGNPIEPDARTLITCDGSRVGLAINEAETSDAGLYSCKLTSPLGEDVKDVKAIVRKVYQPPNFIQKFTDLQQLPTFDAKFPCRISGVPYPEVTWYKDNKPIHETDKYHIKRDGDASCLYVRNCSPGDSGLYKCTATNREGTASCESLLQVVDKIDTRQKVEAPSFLKKIGDTELYKGMTAKFTACATGFPEPEVEWQREGVKLFPSERIRMEKDRSGLLRLTIEGIDTPDVGKYTCRIFNEHGCEECHANLTFDSIDIRPKRAVGDQYLDYDKHRNTGVPVPLSDAPIISKMLDRHLTLSWKPSLPSGPRFPVTYQVEMLDLPHGDWRTVRTGVRSCVCGIPNLEPFKDYKFRIRVENQFGISDPSPFAVTYRQKLEPEPPKFTPYLPPGSQFSLDHSQYFPKDFDIERPLHGNMNQAPVFLRQEDDRQYGVKNHNVNLFWFVYGYPKPKISYTFDDEPIEMGGRFDSSYTRNGQVSLFINKMLDRDVGVYEAIAKNEHGEARQRVRLEIAEPPRFSRRLDENHVLLRKSVRLEAKVTGVPYPELKWYKDWQPLASSSRIKIHFIEPDTCYLTINDIIARDEGLYSLSARNVAGTASSSAMIYISDNEIDYNYYNYTPHINPVKPRTKPYEEMYDLGDELGRGTQGVTYHAVERLTGRNFAAKVMHGRGDLKPFMYNELDIMNSLNHRKLIRLHDAFERDSFMMLVTELASGGELVKDNLLKQTYYTESEIAGYIRQILYGLDYMHDKSIGHFGLNIGDLLISHPGSDDLKICDFGLARRIAMGRLAPLHYGVPEYVSPEAANGEGVGLATDMWSLGIITYILLSGISPFRGKDDRDTLSKVRSGNWIFTDDWWINISSEAQDFIRRLLVFSAEGRMDVKTALKHPWLTRADKAAADEYKISTERLRNYYNLYREWYDNASCKTWYRRNKLTVADSDPSRMVYPPGETYTPTSRTPERIPRKPGSWETRIPERPGLDYEIGVIKSESHYQNGPDTYLLQLRDTDFPVRLREYMKVAARVRPGRTLGDSDYDWRTPSIHERRRFTDVMDEEIDDERKERISKYGSADTYSLRRLRHELGYRLDTYAEAEALIESKQSGSLPFFREKQQIVPIVQGQDVELVCFAVGDPTPVVQFFKNDTIIGETNRVKLTTDEDGRSILKLCPALEFDVGLYKIVARNKVGQTITRTRVVLGTTPDSPDSPTASQVSDTEVLLTWRQPKHDGYSQVLCYSLQYKLCDDVEWTQCADNIDHEFYLIKDLQPEKNYIYRLAARNAFGWGDFGITTAVVKTKAAGVPKIQMSRAMTHLQQLTDSGHQIVIEEKTKLDYSIEKNPIEWDTKTNVTDEYNFISEISRGRFSVVVKAVNKSNDSVCTAKLLECKTETIERTQQEWDAWRSLRHERIVSLLGGFRKPESPIAALIAERLQGADVLTYLSLRHEYSEQTVATIISQVIDGLQYLHWRGYAHLDIQPDNVVLSTVRSVQIKLVDFGSVQKVSKLGTNVSNTDSHPEYTSPEVLSEEPAFPQSDIWSVGVLTYVLLSGTSPFRGKDAEETRQNILYARYRFEHLYKELSQEAVRFIMLIFKRNPNKRPTAEECHENRWFMPTDFMIKKRERAVFLGNRLKEYNEEYHNEKSDAAQSTSLTSISGAKGPLGRSNSIQEEILTAP